MFKSLSFLLVSFMIGVVAINAQDAGAQANALISQLDKVKEKRKEKKDLVIETYLEIKNTAATRKPAELSGRYAEENGSYSLDLQVSGDGTATGSGTDTLGVEARIAGFKLRDARVQGSLLTGTKVYDDGRTEPFEAAFVNRTVREGKTSADAAVTSTAFGIGFIQKAQNWTSRVFLEKK